MEERRLDRLQEISHKVIRLIALKPIGWKSEIRELQIELFHMGTERALNLLKLIEKNDGSVGQGDK